MAEENNRVFQSLKLGHWRQFYVVDIDFHPRLTVLTGTNGAGKSTLLNILTGHLGASRQYLGVPHKAKGPSTIFNGLFRLTERLFDWMRADKGNQQSIGRLTYSDNQIAHLSVNKDVGLSYDINIEGQMPVHGLHMPSHRLMPQYKVVQHLNFTGIQPGQAFNLLLNENYAWYNGNNMSQGNSTLFQLKTILASWAAIGEGNSTIDSDPAQLDAFKGFIDVLRKILPREIGFVNLRVQPPNILLETHSGTFLIDAASGGLVTLIEIAALIYACSLRSDIRGKPFVVTFDEPENHLHPSLQRALMPTLVAAFPLVQFIIATHSPFMVSSVRESNIYVLKYTDIDATAPPDTKFFPSSRRISSTPLDYANRAGTAGEILREVLGVPVTIPEWAEANLDEVVQRFKDRSLDPATLRDLRQAVEQAGLSDLFAEAVTRLGEGR